MWQQKNKKYRDRWFPEFEIYLLVTIQGWAKVGLQLRVRETQFLFLYYCYLFIIVLFILLSVLLLLLLLLLSLAALGRVFIHIFPRQTMTLGNTLLQLFSRYCLWCLYLQFLRWLYCTFTLALFEVCVQCPIWLFSVVP
jgi:hypothetical protein